MKKILLTLFVIAVIPLMLSAQNVIEGEVIVKEGDTPEYCRVTLIHENGDAAELKVGNDGHFVFEEPSPGFHEILFELDGYETLKGDVTIVTQREGCCFYIEANLATGEFHKNPIGERGAEYPLPVFKDHEDFVRQRDDFIKKFDERFHEFDHLIEGVELEPQWVQMVGELGSEHFVGFVPVKHLIAEPNSILGLISVKGMNEIPNGTFVLRLNEATDGVEFFNKENKHAGSLPIIFDDEDRHKLGLYSSEGKPIGSHVGPGDMAGNEQLKKIGDEEDIVVPPGHEGHLCIGYWDGKNCYGIELSW